MRAHKRAGRREAREGGRGGGGGEKARHGETSEKGDTQNERESETSEGSPAYIQKSPVYIQKNPVYIQTLHLLPSLFRNPRGLPSPLIFRILEVTPALFVPFHNQGVGGGGAVLNQGVGVRIVRLWFAEVTRGSGALFPVFSPPFRPAAGRNFQFPPPICSRCHRVFCFFYFFLFFCQLRRPRLTCGKSGKKITLVWS